MMRGKSRPSAETTMALVTPQRLRLPTSDFTRASLKSLATSVPLGRVRVGVGVRVGFGVRARVRVRVGVGVGVGRVRVGVEG